MAATHYTEPAWERQPCDPDARAFSAFTAYLAMGPTRTVTQAAARAGVPRSTAEVWSLEACWDERAELYDAHLARKALESQEQALTTLAVLRTRVARAALTLSAEELEKHLTYSRRTPDMSTTTVRDALRLGFVGGSMARVEEGLAATITETRGNPDRAAHLTDDELAADLGLQGA